MSIRTARTYHLGEVRQRLIEAAIDALRSQPFETISLRSLARTIGASHNAPYMHFADKDALWLAVSDEGFDLMRHQIEAALQPHFDWKERLIAGCNAYVRFALENRQHMLIMFRNAEPETRRALSPKGRDALAVLTREVSSAVKYGKLIAEDPERLAVLIWIMLHGLAMAQIQLGETGGPLQMVPTSMRMEWMINNMLAGMGAR